MYINILYICIFTDWLSFKKYLCLFIVQMYLWILTNIKLLSEKERYTPTWKLYRGIIRRTFNHWMPVLRRCKLCKLCETFIYLTIEISKSLTNQTMFKIFLLRTYYKYSIIFGLMVRISSSKYIPNLVTCSRAG
jgi:hypothetical protein